MLKRLRDNLDDILLLAGIAAVCYGLWLIYPPLAWLACGGAMILIALLNARIQPQGGDK